MRLSTKVLTLALPAGVALLLLSCSAAAHRPSTDQLNSNGKVQGLAPACSGTPPELVLPPTASPGPLGKPAIRATVGETTTIEARVQANAGTPILFVQVLVAEPGTQPGKGFSRRASVSPKGTIDDPDTHLASASTTRDETQTLSVSFTPPIAGTYPIFEINRNSAAGGCTFQGGNGSVGENVIGWIVAS